MATVTVAAATGLGACGGESDEDEAAGVVRSLLDGEPAVCDHLTGDALKFFGGSSGDVKQCRRAVPEIGEEKGAVESVSMRDSSATARVRWADDRWPIMLVKRDGDWMVSGFGEAIPKPPKIQPDLSAKQATDAYIQAIRDGDARAFCGLITPARALEVLGEKSSKQPLRDCVDALEGYDWRKDGKRLEGVKTTSVQIRGETATARLSNDNRARLEQYQGRWVVDDISKASG